MLLIDLERDNGFFTDGNRTYFRADVRPQVPAFGPCPQRVDGRLDIAGYFVGDAATRKICFPIANLKNLAAGTRMKLETILQGLGCLSRRAYSSANTSSAEI